MLLLTLFVMLVLANGMPVIAHWLLGDRWSHAIDGGRMWRDGRPLFGSSKTWRGLISGGIACTLFSMLAGLGLVFGLVFGLLALGGDLVSSFIKRRMGLASSAQALGLDQLPEAAIPLTYAALVLPFPWWQAVVLVLVFGVANVVCSPLLYRLGIRRHPH
ncbi:MAG: CDP-archaeol synthase [Marinobacter sp.]|nr:CDP-archaeol synthase [Marinobacter sp.]